MSHVTIAPPTKIARTIAVILAGGTGVRLGLSYPKQFAKIAGKTVLEHTVEVVERHPRIDEVMIVTHPGHSSEVLGFAHKNGWKKLGRVVAGGADRFGSTWSALEALADLPADTKVLFHDAVRPFLQDSVIDHTIAALDLYNAVDVVIPSADTIVRVDENDRVVGIPPRAELRRGQTPQGFRLGRMRLAYERANALGERAFTCDCGVFLAMVPEDAMGAVLGHSTNIKITLVEDLFLADKLFQTRGDTAAIVGPSHGIADSVIVVLGASEGIGAAIIERATALGAKVFGFSRASTDTDVADQASIQRALEQVIATTGRIDHVVLTAAGLVRKPIITMSDAEIEALLSVNLRGPIDVARLAYPHLRQSGGSLLYFTSSSYTRGRAFHSVYSATKAAVVNLAQALSEEWMEDGVRVNCINPERTRTPMRVKSFGIEPEESLLTAERVAEVSVRVLAAQVTGHVIDVRRPGVVPSGWEFPIGAD